MKTNSLVCPAICKGKILTWCGSCGARIVRTIEKKATVAFSGITLICRMWKRMIFAVTEKGMKRMQNNESCMDEKPKDEEDYMIIR